jgi:hypothetical protein
VLKTTGLWIVLNVARAATPARQTDLCLIIFVTEKEKLEQ